MNWITTIEPSPWRIAGYHLGPLLYGHCLLMERFKGSDTPTALDLWRCLNIASRPYDQARLWLTDDLNCSLSIKRWAFLRVVGKMPRFAEVLTAWNDYMEENTATPEVMTNDSSGDDFGTPYLQSLFNIAVSSLNYNPQEIYHARFGQLVWSILAWNESHGGCRVVSDELSEVFKKMRCQTLS